MRGLKGLSIIVALAIALLLVYAYIDGGRREPRWIEEEIAVQAGHGAPETGE